MAVSSCWLFWLHCRERISFAVGSGILESEERSAPRQDKDFKDFQSLSMDLSAAELSASNAKCSKKAGTDG